MKKVLVLAYFYPPQGGAGVQRTAKFVKYLSEFDWLPIVVAGTGSGSHFHEDTELAQEVKTVKRYDIQFTSLEKKLNSMLQSPLGRWMRATLFAWSQAASRKISTVIEKERPDVLFVTTSPFPAAKVVAALSEKYGIPWVLDMRDPWALDPISHYPTKLHYLLEIRDMKKACHQANAVIMNTPGALRAVINEFKLFNPDKFHCITNGWDANDFRHHEVSDKKCSKPMIIVHTGLFHTKMAWKFQKNNHLLARLRFSLAKINLLTRTPNYLFAAYRKLIDEKKLLAGSIQFVFAGSATDDDMALAKKYQLDSCVNFLGYLNHDQSIDLLHKSDVLFLPLHELHDARNPLIVPGKTFEYIASKKPVLACLPNGDARDIVLKAELGHVCDPSDTEMIATTLLDLFEQYKSGNGISVRPNEQFINKFERRNLTKNLVRIFENVIFLKKNSFNASLTK